MRKTFILIFVSLLFFFSFFFFLRNNQINECNCSPYIFGGSLPEIELRNGNNLSTKNKLRIKINGIEISFKKTDSRITLFSKVKKIDTIELVIDNKCHKIYDFKNYGWKQKFGKNKGVFHCFLQEYKIDTIQIKHAESTNIFVYN